MNMRRFRAIVLATGLAAGLLQAHAADKADYKIGFIGPLSGPRGTVGQNQLKALQSLVDLRNSSGGINGHRIEVLPQEDANDPATGISAARKLIAAGVLVIVGPSSSNIVEAVIPTTSQSGVSVVTAGASPTVLVPAQKAVFQVDQASSSQAQPMVEFAAALLKKADFKTAIGPIDSPSGKAWAENVIKLSQSKGFKITANVSLPVTAADMTPQAQTLIAGNPDVLLVEVLEVPLLTLVRKIRDLGYKGPIVNFHAGASSVALNQMRDPNVYVARTYTHYDEGSTTKGVKEFVQAAKAAGTTENAKSNSLYGSVYVAGLAVLGAISKCGDTCDANAVTNALNSLEVDTQGLTPEPLKFTPDNHQTLTTDQFWHWNDGKIITALDGKRFRGSVYSLDVK